MSIILAISAAAALSGTAAPAAASSMAAPPPVEAFARMPRFRDVAISPSGQRFSAMFRADDADEYRFVVFDRSDGLTTLFAAEQTDEFRVHDPVWLTEDRLMFTLRFKAKRYGTDTVETRLMTLDPVSGEIGRLFKDPRRGQGMPVQIEDDIVSMLPDDPDTILVQYRDDEASPSVYQVRTDKRSRHRRVLRGKADILDWQADESGQIRAGWGIADDKRETLRVRLPDGEWRKIDHRVAPGAPDFRFVGFPNRADKAFVASSHETETAALYVYDIASDSFGEQLFHSPDSDVYDVIQQRGTGAGLGVTFANDDGDIHWFGENFVRDVFRRLDRTFPERSFTITGLNAPQTHASVLVQEDGRPGAYMLFGLETNVATRLPSQYPGLDDAALGRVIPVDYEARDGLVVPGYVTLPPGIDGLADAAGLPFVLFPHGGPAARDFADFDWWAQFVASRGYGVMQMNFRGSAGYGQAYRDAGARQWGQAMQDDITDAAAWLVAEGHADPDRLAIMGGSYGGYAALMGAVKTPDLYQCAAAFAPVTDLPRLLARAKDYVGGTYGTRHIGRLWGDRKMLRENSPALRADEIEVPILLVHGEEDRVVDIDQSERMVTGMKRQGTAYRYVELPMGSHYLDVGDNRLTFLRELEAFLGDCLDE